MRLKEESDKNLRGLLEFYFSDEAKQIAGDWIRINYGFMIESKN